MTQRPPIKLSDSLSETLTPIVDASDFGQNFPLTSGILLAAGSYGLLRLGIYWRAQVLTASLLGGIPPNSKIVDIGAVDGKNVFYLPKGSDYTAVMNPKGDPTKQKEVMRTNEQLILECIGKANV